VSGKPNSDSFTVEADWAPFGKDDSWPRPFANLKLGTQYTAHPVQRRLEELRQLRRNANANNTLFIFA
jgi:hypothetical protein